MGFVVVGGIAELDLNPFVLALDQLRNLLDRIVSRLGLGLDQLRHFIDRAHWGCAATAGPRDYGIWPCVQKGRGLSLREAA